MPLRLRSRHIPLTHAILHDGTEIFANASAEMRRKIAAYLQSIGYVTGNFQAYVEDCACKTLPPHACVQEAEPPPRKLSLVDVVTFLRAIAKWVSGGGKFVSEEQAKARGLTCQSCPFMQEIPGCKSCTGVATWLSALLGDRQVPNLPRLAGCDFCGCSLQLKALLPIEALEYQDQPDYCWVTREKGRAGSPSGEPRAGTGT